MKVAVVILNYNSLSDCRKCVSFLKDQQGVELEIILVDNCSKDRIQLELLSKEQDCVFIASDENRGYNAGNNIGLRYAAQQGYEYALIVNPDMEFPEKDYVARLVGVIQSDNQVVIAASDIITPEGFHQNPYSFKHDTFANHFEWIINLFQRHSNHKKQDWNVNYKRTDYCAIVNGCCFLIRLDFLKEINFFDEDVFLFGEEKILGKQVELAQYKMLYFGEVSAIHNHKKEKEGKQSLRLKLLKDSGIIYLKKYCGFKPWQRCLAYVSLMLKYKLLFIKYR